VRKRCHTAAIQHMLISMLAAEIMNQAACAAPNGGLISTLAAETIDKSSRAARNCGRDRCAKELRAETLSANVSMKDNACVPLMQMPARLEQVRPAAEQAASQAPSATYASHWAV